MNHRVTSREQILEQAMAISVRDGIGALSIRKLSRACGIAIGSVYNYFPNKEALTAAVSEVFWTSILEDQDKVYRRGMGFTDFLEQYYRFLYAKLAKYDKSWLIEMSGRSSEKSALLLLHMVLKEDPKVNAAIWNMELNEASFCDYVLTNLMALLQAGENNCRFFLFLLEHLLYDRG